MEIRIATIVQDLAHNVFPWQWDWDHYSGENADMIGFFYPEDIAAIRQIRHFENKYREHNNKS